MNRKKPFKNKAEQSFAEDAQKRGWEVTKRGWPDFLCFKDGRFVAVEVKKTRNSVLRMSQIRVMEALCMAGIRCYRFTPDEGMVAFRTSTEMEKRARKLSERGTIGGERERGDYDLNAALDAVGPVCAVVVALQSVKCHEEHGLTIDGIVGLTGKSRSVIKKAVNTMAETGLIRAYWRL